ncbi:HD domain-containing protein [Phycicoccus sp. BSK3Z-2]|uniref:HD domain-containing protein n=1 Tax=Phycicoccus avicenniae TaxID=2828860 RepID=A0A941I0C7_9MICO|nr:HD domain-containing phosphohydrolase [Phycicoccus avicenniae]MBR7743780.1 HD domain-containing protein [Phycicoccus avicenniae]
MSRVGRHKEGRPTPRTAATAVYIGAVSLLAVALLAVSLPATEGVLGVELLILTLLGAVLVRLEQFTLQGKTWVSLWSIVLLACSVLVGPAGAAVAGAVMGALQGRDVALRGRIFNCAQASATGALGGFAYLAVGGRASAAGLDGATAVLSDLALPILVADVVQFAGNVLLLTGVVVVSRTGSIASVIVPVLRSAGISYLGYGAIAFLLVVLWRPAGLGPAAALLVLAPLLVAQWAYRQLAEELSSQQRVMDVLVAAVEAKEPALTGHSARVALLAASVGDAMGLGPSHVNDLRMAGMLHDVGRTSLPTREGRVHTPSASPAGPDPYPDRGVALLRDLPFLEGALPAINDHRRAVEGGGEDLSSDARILGVVDEYDLLVSGARGGARLTSEEAVASLERMGAPAAVLDVLRRVVSRQVGAP